VQKKLEETIAMSKSSQSEQSSKYELQVEHLEKELRDKTQSVGTLQLEITEMRASSEQKAGQIQQLQEEIGEVAVSAQEKQS
jgi:CII-binding regulator of phage lambda lysogenization HflD